MEHLCGNCFKHYEGEKGVCPHCRYNNNKERIGNNCLPQGYVLQGRYVIGRVLGVGGFGITYLAYDTILEVIIAIKEYLPGEFSTRIPTQAKVTVYTGEKEEQFRAGQKRFVEEAKKLARFQNHEGIVHIYGCFEDNNTSYISMEYLKGKTLQTILKEKGPFAVSEATDIICDILLALDDVHKAGILHRDIAPDNIILTDSGQVKLFDFGAARYATTSHSKSLSVVIKQGYAPVEQYRSRGDQGPWTDVYGVAATMYKMITGVTPEDSMERMVKDELAAPSKMGVKIDKSTENALLNALNILAEGRYQSAADFCAALRSGSVRRNSLKIKKTDLGKWPLGIKISLGVLAAAVAVVLVLIVQGKFNLSISKWGLHQLAQGQSRVPNIVNTDIEQAQTIVEESKLVFLIVNKEYSEQIPKSKILVQSIHAGSVVDEGSTVEVTVSGGTKMDEILDNMSEDETLVPDVQYKSEDEAVSMLEKSELTAEVTYEESETVEEGKVIRQDTAENEVVKKGSSIGIVVSRKEQIVRPSTRTNNQSTQQTNTEANQTPVTQAPDPTPASNPPAAAEPSTPQQDNDGWQGDFELDF